MTNTFDDQPPPACCATTMATGATLAVGLSPAAIARPDPRTSPAPGPRHRRPSRHDRGSRVRRPSPRRQLDRERTGRPDPAPLSPTAGTTGSRCRHRLRRSRPTATRWPSSVRPSAYEVEPAAGTQDLRLHAINTVDGPAIDAPRDRVRRWSGLSYLSRAGWGADESLRFEADGTEKFPTAFFDVQTLTVHHTVTANTDPDPAATVRAIYFFHCVTSDFGDIGYHLLIDQAGTVYEGRYSGPDPVPVFGPRSVGPRPSMVNAAHVGGFNAGNMGVALLGDLTSDRADARRPAGAGQRAGHPGPRSPTVTRSARPTTSIRSAAPPAPCPRWLGIATGRRPSAQATPSTPLCQHCAPTWRPRSRTGGSFPYDSFAL